MSNSGLPSVAFSVESCKPLRTKISTSLSEAPNHLADVFSNVRGEPPKLLLVIPRRVCLHVYVT